MSISRDAHREFFLLDHPAIDMLIAQSGDPIIIQARNAGSVYLNAKILVGVMEDGPLDDMLPGIHLQLRQQARESLAKAEALYEKSIDLVNTLYLIETKCNCPLCKPDKENRRLADLWASQFLKANLS